MIDSESTCARLDGGGCYEGNSCDEVDDGSLPEGRNRLVVTLQGLSRYELRDKAMCANGGMYERNERLGVYGKPRTNAKQSTGCQDSSRILEEVPSVPAASGFGSTTHNG